MPRHCCDRRSIFFAGCLLSFLAVVVYYRFSPQIVEFKAKSRRKEIITKVRENPVLIYHPLDFTSHPHTGSGIFHRQGCQIRNCILTTSETHKYTADVIIFGENSAWERPLPRRADQLWIIRLLESPENTQSLQLYDNQVNATVSYREDSDLPIAYGHYQPFPSPLRSTAKADYTKGKTGMVCWIVSNCFTNNHRMEYTRRLSQYIQVNIYGACGKRSLAKEEAYHLIREKYKFYLAFENSNCRQYITEKFWINALRNNAVPIVMGAPKADYVKVAPPHSFIHIEDYSPEQLARYLQYLDRNATAYNEYFAWKSYGRIVDSNFFCRLCAFVQSPPTKTYKNLDKWWRGNDDCQKYSSQ